MPIEEEVKENLDTIHREEVPELMFEFYDTLNKIKKLQDGIKVYFTEKMANIFIVLEQDDVVLSESIMKKFAQWEACYKIFPELHIINKNEMFYVPTGSEVF